MEGVERKERKAWRKLSLEINLEGINLFYLGFMTLFYFGIN